MQFDYEHYETMEEVRRYIYEHYDTMEEVRSHIQECEGKHPQQVAYSTFHDALTQVCYGCKKIRSSMKIYE